MEFTCLSKGKGYYFPPCHILDVCGFRILFDCPLDLSSLAVFSPVPNDAVAHDERRKADKPLDAGSLICAEPRYRTVKNLLLWNVSFIDLVLISSPMGMLGLPFLTRNKDFSAKVYATEAAAKIGKFMLDDLVNMHKEFRQFYGPEETEGPKWMKWDEVEKLPFELRQVMLGTDGLKFGAWMPLYSAADVKACLLKVMALKYAEEACYNGILIIKAFSSGLEIGSCNWSITTPKGNIAYMSNFSFCNAPENFDSGLDGKNLSNLSEDDMHLEARSVLINDDEYLEEMEKLNFISSCAIDSIKAGGSVLIPIGRLSIILQLLERFSQAMASEDRKVPIYVVSTVAEELMAYTNIIPEWLCEHWQDRLYSGQPIFAHSEMLKDKKLHLFPAIHSLELLTIWQEPCIVICPHWSLRLGPVVHLLRRWCWDRNSLLVMEEGVDAKLALLPYQPMAMKVLQCSFISGIDMRICPRLLKMLQPKNVLFPETLRQQIVRLETSLSFTYYSENKTVCFPYPKENSELDIEVELACRLHYTTLKHQKDMTVARLKGEFTIKNGRYSLISRSRELIASQSRPQVYSGHVDTNALVTALQMMGMVTTVEEMKCVDGSHEGSLIHVVEPRKAVVEATRTQTLISTGDEDAASLISQAVRTILDCI
ncbi:uncharacterized protein LOC127246658 isoform X2 [Andrographis paniculata]|uniref:uncharacterized protein LOC127246658 isoform X2 n=1 Tax=Andrographis paniculata TaxID=175694 RepID=UPI0021E7546C|nr:uncharacterized protein LOC127246658 isoform X2 [Andrographis paniculata]